MKEKPILFNTEMVKAILDGRKTQSRRPFTKTNKRDFALASQLGEVSNFMENGIKGNDLSYIKDLSPYRIGDQLYVRETWQRLMMYDTSDMPTYDYTLYYKTDGAPDIRLLDEDGYEEEDQTFKWKPSIHMPKKYARIWLEITDIRVERVNDIDEKGALADGGWEYKNCPYHKNPERSYQDLWNSIYKNWSDNPWVWAIEFKRIDK